MRDKEGPIIKDWNLKVILRAVKKKIILRTFLLCQKFENNSEGTERF